MNHPSQLKLFSHDRARASVPLYDCMLFSFPEGIISMAVADTISSNAMVISWRVYGNEVVERIILNYSIISTNTSCTDSEQVTSIDISGSHTYYTISSLHGATVYSITVTALLDDKSINTTANVSASVIITASTPLSGLFIK